MTYDLDQKGGSRLLLTLIEL